MDKRNICYYSTKCSWSKAFIMEVSQTPYKAQFQFISVDPPNNQGLPKWLKKVPTLVIQGESEPRTDGEVMNWLYEKKLQNQQAGQGGQGGGQQSGGESLEGWNSAEHTSFSKNVGYSFNDSDTSSTGNGGLTIPGAFSFLNGNNGVGEKTSQDYNPGKSEQGRNKSKKEEMFDKQMEEYQRSRDAGMPQQRRVM